MAAVVAAVLAEQIFALSTDTKTRAILGNLVTLVTPREMVEIPVILEIITDRAVVPESATESDDSCCSSRTVCAEN